MPIRPVAFTGFAFAAWVTVVPGMGSIAAAGGRRDIVRSHRLHAPAAVRLGRRSRSGLEITTKESGRARSSTRSRHASAPC